MLYVPDGTAHYPYEASISGETVLARYQEDIPDAASRAAVRYDAVEDVQGVPNIEGDYPLTVEAQAGDTTDPYPAPLAEVGNYRLVWPRCSSAAPSVSSWTSSSTALPRTRRTPTCTS